MSSGLRRSTCTARTPAPVAASLSALAWIASSSAATTRSYPSLANSLASSKPIPLEAPVSSARRVAFGMVADYPTSPKPNSAASAAGFPGHRDEPRPDQVRPLVDDEVRRVNRFQRVVVGVGSFGRHKGRMDRSITGAEQCADRNRRAADLGISGALGYLAKQESPVRVAARAGNDGVAEPVGIDGCRLGVDMGADLEGEVDEVRVPLHR